MWIKTYKQVRALKKLFLKPDGELKKDAETVLEWLREEVNAKGNRVLGIHSSLFGDDGRFDSGKVCYNAGQRRVYDLIISRLSVDERKVFNLAAEFDEEEQKEQLMKDLTTI